MQKNAPRKGIQFKMNFVTHGELMAVELIVE